MGACYSKQGHNATLSPKHRSLQHKNHKNGGVPIKIEYTPVRPQEDDRISILHKDDANSSPEKQDLVAADKVESDSEEKGGVAPSDSGIESLAANDNVTGHLDNISSHSPERECSPSSHQCDLNKDQTGETYCTCGPRGACKQQWNLNHDPKVDNSGDTPQPPPTSTTTVAGSKQPRHNSAGSISLENVSVEVPISAKRLSQEIRRFDSEASLDLSSSVSSMHEVRTMQLNGKEVVVIELETYCQIMDEIDFLKMKLSQLTDLIQEQDLSPTDSCKTRSPSVTSS